MTKIGITGGIGSGKSYVCNLLKQKGYPVYNCDEEAKRLMTGSPVIRERLCQLIGTDAYIGTALNKPVIAAFLFDNADNAAKVNQIVHPVVRQDFHEWAERQQAPVVIQECALLFESGFADTVDVTIEVYAPKELRIQRAMTRDHATAKQIEARMAQQMDEEKKRQLADYCILNDGTADLHAQLRQLIREAEALTQGRD